jgi:hypothetical protein
MATCSPLNGAIATNNEDEVSVSPQTPKMSVFDGRRRDKIEIVGIEVWFDGHDISSLLA